MYGVVLWSDVNDKKAVIWCEDHGDLAYFGGHEASAFDGPALDAGDLVYFDVKDCAPMRLARNPELVSECHAPALAARLRAAMDPAPVSRPEAETTQEVANSQENILVFPTVCSA